MTFSIWKMISHPLWLKCSDEEYDKASAIAQDKEMGTSSPSRKVALAAGALRHRPTPPKPPPGSRFNDGQDWLVPGSFENESRNGYITKFTTVAISPMLYGLVHTLAWSEQFPTPAEHLLWRVCSLVATFSGPVGVSGALLLGWLEGRSVNYTLKGLGRATTFIGVPFVHVLASLFFIVESFRQLFFLSHAAYKLPALSQYWPHLS